MLKTELIEAAKNGDKTTVENLLARGAAVDQADKYGYTALHVAAADGHEAIARLLLKHRATMNSADKDGYMPLHCAASRGHVEIARILLEHGVAVDQADKYGYTALHVAASRGHIGIARFLLGHKATADQVNRSSYTALHFTAAYGHQALAGLLLEHGVAVDQAGKYGYTALHFAAARGRESLAGFLLTAGADVNGARLDGETPLFLTALYGRESTAKLLLENGAALHKATYFRHTSPHTFRLVGRQNLTPLTCASYMGHVGVRAAFETHLDWRQYMPLLKQILTPSSNKETAPGPEPELEPEPETAIAVTRQKIVDGVLEIDQLDGDTSRRVIDALLRDTSEQRLAWGKFFNPRLSSENSKFPCPELMTKIGGQLTAATATIEKFAKIIAALFDLQDYINEHKDERKAAAEEILKNLLALTESGEIVSQDNYIKVVECLSLKNYKEFFEPTRLYGLTGLQDVFNKISKRFGLGNYDQNSRFIELKNVLDSTREKAEERTASFSIQHGVAGSLFKYNKDSLEALHDLDSKELERDYAERNDALII